MTDQRVEFLDERFPTHVKQTLDLIIQKHGFISYDINNKTIDRTENFLGNLQEVDVKGKTKDGDKEIYLFIKLPREVNIVFCTIAELYKREFYAYSELFKIYEELQDDVNVQNEERLKVVKYFDGSSSEAIVLENLSRKGFKTLPKKEVVPLLFAELSMEQLAKFHALSVVLQNQRPEYFESKVMKLLKTFPTMESSQHEDMMRNLFDIAIKYLSEESKKYVTILMDTYREEVKKYLRMSKMFKCLCHGDFRISNLLYKEQDFGKKEVIVVDYQIVHYGSPILDLLYFIFLNTDSEFRRKHLNHLKNLYYTSFERFLKYFDLDLNDMWSREEFENQFQEGLHIGLIHGMGAFPFLFNDPSDVLDLENDIKVTDMKPEIITRLQGIVDDVIKWRGLSCSSVSVS